MTGHDALDANFDLEHFLPYRLQRLAALLTTDFFTQLDEGPVDGWVAFYVLHALGTGEGITATEIAARSGLGKTAVSRAVAALDEAGLIGRRRDALDRRIERLGLTRPGALELRRMTEDARNYAGTLSRLVGLSQHDKVHAAMGDLELALNLREAG